MPCTHSAPPGSRPGPTARTVRTVFALCLLLSTPLLAYVSRQAQGAVRPPAPPIQDPRCASDPQVPLTRLLRADPQVVAIDPGPEGAPTVNVFVRHGLDHAGLVAVARRLRDRLERGGASPGFVRVSAGQRGDVVAVQALPPSSGGAGPGWVVTDQGRLLL